MLHSMAILIALRLFFLQPIRPVLQIHGLYSQNYCTTITTIQLIYCLTCLLDLFNAGDIIDL